MLFLLPQTGKDKRLLIGEKKDLSAHFMQALPDLLSKVRGSCGTTTPRGRKLLFKVASWRPTKRKCATFKAGLHVRRKHKHKLMLVLMLVLASYV